MVTMYYSTARSQALTDIKSPKAGTWIHAVAPSEAELAILAGKFNLDEDLLQDAIDPYESPRVERENGAVYVFTRYVLPESNTNATDTMLLIYTSDYLITIMRSESPVLQRLTAGLERVITTQKTKTMLQILEELNESYRRSISRTTRQLLAVRSQLKKRDISNEVLIGFVDLEDDLNEFLNALQPQAVLLRTLLNDRYMRLYEEDKDLIDDLSLGTNELIELAKSRVKTIVNIRQAYEAVATSELNRIFRRLTSISIFLMVPTIVFSFYGMNVKLPFDDDPLAFWYIIGFVLAITWLSIFLFRRRKWL